MKNDVKLSTYSVIVSWLTMIILVVIAVYGYEEGSMPNWLAYSFGFLLIFLFISGCSYMPLSISADDKQLKINRLLRTKRIPLNEIKAIGLCQPTLAERRICGSGGFMGYWGWFSEPSIGKYFAYYGKASDCFYIELRTGRKYMLGCKNPKEIVDYILQRLG